MDVLALEVDVTRASIDSAALEQLRACSQSRHLPAHIYPAQSDCRLSMLAPEDACNTAGAVGLAA